jgi:predicted DNA-binding transcriptional regulator AlpA
MRRDPILRSPSERRRFGLAPPLPISVEIMRNPSEFVTMAVSARALGVNRPTVYRLYRDGRLAVHAGTARCCWIRASHGHADREVAARRAEAVGRGRGQRLALAGLERAGRAQRDGRVRAD